jgi:hypothetical protein
MLGGRDQDCGLAPEEEIMRVVGMEADRATAGWGPSTGLVGGERAKTREEQDDDREEVSTHRGSPPRRDEINAAGS